MSTVTIIEDGIVLPMTWSCCSSLDPTYPLARMKLISLLLIITSCASAQVLPESVPEGGIQPQGRGVGSKGGGCGAHDEHRTNSHQSSSGRAGDGAAACALVRHLRRGRATKCV